MIKTISKVGNSHALIFDKTMMQMGHLKSGDEVNVEFHSGGTITITPVAKDFIGADEASDSAKRIIEKNSELFRRLS